MMLTKKKAQSLPLNVVIIAVILLVVLVVLIVIFTSKTGKFAEAAESCSSKGGECLPSCESDKVVYAKVDATCQSERVCCIKLYDKKP